ncbi:MAG: tetratricopeptide repeat protein, partial [Elusimicrobiaceae bacterium]|nr:tetratricopeptide repeat protein [Elusimicrobiaceae bacterium]
MSKKQQPTVKQEQEAIISLLSGTKKYVRDHKKRIFTGAVILVLVIVFGYAYTAHVKKVQEHSWAAYSNAQLSVMSDPAAVTQLDGVALQYPGTLAAQYAQLLKGDILYAGENYAQAADAYEPLTNAGNETLRTVAVLSLAAARQATQD